MSGDEEAADLVFVDVFGAEVTLTAAVRAVILAKHPEVVGFLDHIGIVLRWPDEARQSGIDERSVLYHRHGQRVLGGKSIVVVVKRVARHYVSTVYATDRIKSGAVIWQR